MITHSVVETERPDRYAKQLVSHLSRKCQTEEVENGTRLRIAPPDGPVAYGIVLVVGASDEVPGSLVLVAEGDSDEALERAERVLGNHLVRFGEKDGLVVEWTAGPYPA